MWIGGRIAPYGVKVFNPAFDVTPNELITAIATEFGVCYPPYRKSLAAAKKKAQEEIEMNRQKRETKYAALFDELHYLAYVCR